MKLAEAEGKRIEIPFLKEKSKFFHRNFCFSRRVPYHLSDEEHDEYLDKDRYKYE